MIVVHLLIGGRTTINGEPVSQSQMPGKLAEVYQAREDRLLRLVADDDVDYGEVVSLIDHVQDASPGLEIMILRNEPSEQLERHFCSVRWPSYTSRLKAAVVP